MRIIISIIFIFLYPLSSNGQEILKSLPINSFEDVFKDTLEGNIYSLNVNEFKNLIKKSNKEFHLLYFYAWWCKPCIKNTPEVINSFVKMENIKLYIINAERDESQSLFRTKNNLVNKHKIKESTFMISNFYGNRPKKKIVKFVSELWPEHKKYGFSLLLLFDKQDRKLYASTYDEDIEERIKKIKQIIEKY